MDAEDLTFDIYAWKSPRDLDASGAEALLKRWHEARGDRGDSRFEPSTDVGWFYREVLSDLPGIQSASDIAPNPSTKPIWLSANDKEPPARVVALRASPDAPSGEHGTIFSLAAKYDLVLFDARNRRIHLPLEAMAAHASATFWPAGAIQAAVAGGIGGVVAVAAWFLGIPLLSGLLVLVGAFMFAGAIYTFIHEGRKAA